MKLEHIRQFVVVAQTGTLTKAAQELHVSQSTLTRNMYNLEHILGVKLFNRAPNSIELTPTGVYVLPRFQELVRQHQETVDDIRLFNSRNTIVKGNVCAQGPAWKVKQLFTQSDAYCKLSVELAPENELLNQLQSGSTDFIVTSFPLQADNIETKYFFQEQLYLSVPPGHALHDKQELYLAELAGQTLLIRSQLGIWQDLIDSLDHINFIVQDRKTFDRLISQFSLPAFSTNISQQYKLGDNRKNIKILDTSARKDYYLSFLPKNKEKLDFLFS